LKEKTMKKHKIIILAAALLAHAGLAWAATTEEFIRKTAMGTRFEIDAGNLAAEKASAGPVKTFALQMIADHGKAGQDFKAALEKAGLSTPSDEPDDEHQEVLAALKAADVSSFDGQYIKSQIDAHEDTIALFREYANSGDNDTLKGFARDTLPTLESHQEMIHDIAEKRMSGTP
jgi:putative membrane protein